LFERYRAMFALRNAVHNARRRAELPSLSDEERKEAGEEGKQAVLALADGLSDGSALFRYVSLVPLFLSILLHTAKADAPVASGMKSASSSASSRTRPAFPP
jgi:hypothetical protein